MQGTATQWHDIRITSKVYDNENTKKEKYKESKDVYKQSIEKKPKERDKKGK